MADKPFSPACERNQAPIEHVLKSLIRTGGCVLEVGSGTGQHGVYIAAQRPDLIWQTSDQGERLAGLRQWVNEAGLPNLPAPLELDVTDCPENVGKFNTVFAANVVHYIPRLMVSRLVEVMSKSACSDGQLIFYGPFNAQGFTSSGNAALDIWLKRDVAPDAGIWEQDDFLNLLRDFGWSLQAHHPMPSNNRMLGFRRVDVFEEETHSHLLGLT
jgi:cyclopropane fatty-acyl-phospholipid synthase-like methyltransferase